MGLDTSVRMGANLTKNLGAIKMNFVYYRIFETPEELSKADRSMVEGRRGPYQNGVSYVRIKKVPPGDVRWHEGNKYDIALGEIIP